MKNRPESLFFILLTFTLIAVLTFFMLMPKKEHFFINIPSGKTSFSLYEDGKFASADEFDKAYNMTSIMLDDKDDLLQMKRCYQLPNTTVESLRTFRNKLFPHDVDGGMKTVTFDMVTCSFDDVQSRIICEIQKFHERAVCKSTATMRCNSYPNSHQNVSKWSETQKCPAITDDTRKKQFFQASCDGKLVAPIYVMLTQAPYYRNSKNEIMPVQFTMDRFGGLPFNPERSADSDAPIYYHVIIMFARYNRYSDLLPIDYMRDSYLPFLDKFLFSNEKQCFIMTKNNTKRLYLPGGCATMTTPYSSRCLGPSKPYQIEGDEKKTDSTYCILYEVNPAFSIISNIIESGNAAPPPIQASCGKFDEKKYTDVYPDVKTSTKTPFEHWATEGIQRGRLGFIKNKESGGLWDSTAYYNTHYDVKNARVNPTNHLKSFGWKEKRKICLKSHA